MSIKTYRAIAAATAASIALTSLGLAPAAAAPLASEVSYRHSDGAAALAAFAAFAGTIAAIAAERHDRDAYYDGGPYGYAPYPYGRWDGWHGHWHRH
jgi:hypothetical protein